MLKTWMLFFFIGSFVMLPMSGCSENADVDFIVKTSYHYVNATHYQIEMDIFNAGKVLLKSSTVQPTDTLVFSFESEGGSGPFQFTDSNGFGDSIYLAFSDLRYLILRKDVDSIFFEKSYIKIKSSESAYDLYYFLTPELFDQAEEIN